MNHEGHERYEFVRGFLVFVIVVCFVVSSPAQFRARVETVQVTVTVTDANGRLIAGLARDDFEVLEDGVPQPITVFTSERVPVSLGVLLDASDSMRGRRMADARAAVDQFLMGLLDRGDEAFVAAFNHRPRLVAPWTRPPSALAGDSGRVLPSGGTALYDSLVASAGYFVRRVHPRSALVVVSDGVDTASDWTLPRARDVLQHADPLVYAIAVDSTLATVKRPSSVEALREITTTSGGYTEVVTSTAELGPATARIADELNKQYTLGYVPMKPPDGQWRGIRVRVHNSDYVTRARRGYYAMRP